MRCVDCVVKWVNFPQEAEWYLIDNEYLKPLCQECLDEYIQMEGEMNLDFYHKNIGGEALIYRINDILKYLNDINQRFSDRYFAAKKMAEDCRNRNIKIEPEAMLEAIKW